MAEIGAMMPRILKTAGTYFFYLLSYLLAGSSLIATILLILILHDIISQTRASYPPLRPISGSSLSKPIFLRSVPVETPKGLGRSVLSASPDGRSVAYWGVTSNHGERGLHVAGIDDDVRRLVWVHVTSHTWSPDSRKLLLHARQYEQGTTGIAIISLDAEYDPAADPSIDWIVTPVEASTPNPPIPVTAASWSPDGKAVIFVQPKASEGLSELWRHEVEGGQKQRLAVLPKESDKPNTYVRNLSISPDGKKVSFVNVDRLGTEKSSTWWIMSADGSSPLPLMRRAQDSGFVQKWQWSPDGRQIMYDTRLPGDAQYQPTTLWIMNSDGTAKRQVSVSDNIDGFALMPRGNWAIYGRESHLWLVNLESGQEEQLTFGDDSESKPMWLANGDILYQHKVGSISSLRLLEHAEPQHLPGIVTPAVAKAP